jgi:hypothetical protein
MAPVLAGRCLIDRRSTLTWPIQQSPTKAVWQVWSMSLQTLCIGDTLITPLSMKESQGHQSWFWYIDNQRLLHCHGDKEWTAFRPVSNSSRSSRSHVTPYCKLSGTPTPTPRGRLSPVSVESSQSLLYAMVSPESDHPVSSSLHPNVSQPNVHHALTSHPFYQYLLSNLQIADDTITELAIAFQRGLLSVGCTGSFDPLVQTASFSVVFGTEARPIL